MPFQYPHTDTQKMQWFRKWGNKGVKIKLNENVCMSDYTYKLTYIIANGAWKNWFQLLFIFRWISTCKFIFLPSFKKNLLLFCKQWVVIETNSANWLFCLRRHDMCEWRDYPVRITRQFLLLPFNSTLSRPIACAWL